MDEAMSDGTRSPVQAGMQWNPVPEAWQSCRAQTGDTGSRQGRADRRPDAARVPVRPGHMQAAHRERGAVRYLPEGAAEPSPGCSRQPHRASGRHMPVQSEPAADSKARQPRPVPAGRAAWTCPAGCRPFELREARAVEPVQTARPASPYRMRRGGSRSERPHRLPKARLNGLSRGSHRYRWCLACCSFLAFLCRDAVRHAA